MVGLYPSSGTVRNCVGRVVRCDGTGAIRNLVSECQTIIEESEFHVHHFSCSVGDGDLSCAGSVAAHQAFTGNHGILLRVAENFS